MLMSTRLLMFWIPGRLRIPHPHRRPSSERRRRMNHRTSVRIAAGKPCVYTMTQPGAVPDESSKASLVLPHCSRITGKPEPLP